MTKRIPNKITPDLIHECILELRFNTQVPSEAFFGIFYNKLNNAYSNIEKLPILQLPDVIRTNEQIFKHKPHYKLQHNTNSDIVLQVGPNVVLISNVNHYIGWEGYINEIHKIIDNLLEVGQIAVERVGLRYINFIGDSVPIHDKLELEVKLPDLTIGNTKWLFRTEFDRDDFTTVLTLNSDVQIIKNNAPAKGALIDIDVICKDLNKLTDGSKIKQIIASAHDNEKEWFVNLLKQDYIDTLDPQYD